MTIGSFARQLAKSPALTFWRFLIKPSKLVMSLTSRRARFFAILVGREVFRFPQGRG